MFHFSKHYNWVSPRRFCATQWVEDKSVAERALEIWDPSKKVMKYWVGLSKSKQPGNKSYECLKTHYTDPLVPSKLQFFAFVAGIFEPYLVMFQTDAPMLPFMFSELEKIFSRLMRLIFKKEKLTIPITERIKKKWLMDKNNHLEHDALVDMDAATKVSLKGVQLSEEKKNKFRGQCRTMVLDILVKLPEKTPLCYAVVPCASSLSPGNMIRVPQECSQMFVVLADVFLL